MPSLYSSIDASIAQSTGMMEIHRLGISRRKIGKCRSLMTCEISRKGL